MRNSKWIYLGSLGFLASVLLSFIYIFHGQRIFSSDKAILYFILLFPMGIASAVFLFKVLKSTAEFNGKYLSSALKLGGPAVIFGLIYVGGFYFYKHPPAPDKYNFTISFKDSSNLNNILHGRTTISYGNSAPKIFDVRNGGVYYENATPGDNIEISADIPGYILKHNSAFQVPFPSDPLVIYLYEDSAELNKMKRLLAVISSALNSYLSNAEDFRDIFQDTNYILDSVDLAVRSLNTSVVRYGESYEILNRISDSIIKENNKFLVVNPPILDSVIANFRSLHAALFESYNNDIKPLLTSYWSTRKNSDRLDYIQSLQHQIKYTRDQFIFLTNNIPLIQKSLTF